MISPVLLLAASILSMFALPRLALVEAWDLSALSYFAARRSDGVNSFFKFVSASAGTFAFLLALLGPALWLSLRGRKRTALFYFLGVGLLKLSVSFWKATVGRPRPEGGLEIMTNLAMPSGHAFNSVVIFGILGLALGSRLKAGPARFAAVIFCLVWIGTVGLSRVYLGVHYPSDVLIGWIYAAAGLWLLRILRPDVFRFFA